MSSYTKFIIARVLCISLMWGAISMIYLTRRGLDPHIAVRLFGYYGLAIVFLEYPTGVISDVYGHKSSVVLGGIISAAGIFLLSFALPWWGYALGLTLHAIGMSLFSGSTTAFLKQLVGEEFPQKYPTVKAIATGSRGIVAVLGGFLFTLHPTLPVIVPACMSLLGALVFLTIPYKKAATKNESFSGNVYKTAVSGISHIYSSKTLLTLFFLFILLLGFRYSIKTFVTIMDDFFLIGIPILTGVVGAQFAIRALGNYSISKVSYSTALLCSFFLFFLLILQPITSPYFYLGCYLILSFFITICATHTDIYVTEHTDSSILATVLSSYSLGWRLTGSAYMFFAGYLLNIISYTAMIQIIGGILFLGLLLFFLSGTKIDMQHGFHKK